MKKDKEIVHFVNHLLDGDVWGQENKPRADDQKGIDMKMKLFFYSWLMMVASVGGIGSVFVLMLWAIANLPFWVGGVVIFLAVTAIFALAITYAW